MKLFAYECHKLIGNRSLLSLLAMCLCLNAILLYYTSTNSERSFPTPNEAEALIEEYHRNPEKMEDNYHRILEWNETQERRWQEEMNQGNFYWEPDVLLSFYAKEGTTDLQVLEWLFQWESREERYRSQMDAIRSNAEKNMRELESKSVSHESYAWAVQARVKTIYSSLKDKIHFSSDFCYGWDTYFRYESVNMFLTLSVVITALSLIIAERSTGTVFLIHTSKNGRMPVIRAKIGVLICGVGVLVLLFTLESLLLIGFQTGYSSANIFIQELSDYQYCPYALRIWQFLLMTIFTKWLVFTAFGLLSLLLGVVLKDYALAAVGSILVVGINVFLNFHHYLQPDSVLQNVNMEAVAFGHSIFNRYKGVNLAGQLVSIVPLTICFYVLVSFLVITVLIILNNTALPTADSRASSWSKKIQFPQWTKAFQLPIVFGKTIPGAEFIKCFGSPFMWLVIVAVLVLDVKLYQDQLIPPTSYAEQVYCEYMTLLNGECTEEKVNMIQNERARINSVLACSAEKKEAYQRGILTVREYSDYLIEYNNADARNSVLADVEAYLDSILEYQKKGEEAWFVYDTGWKTLSDAPFDWGLFAVLLLLSVNVFPIEFSDKVSEGSAACLIRSTLKGRRTVYLWKMLTLGITAGIVGLLFLACRLAVLTNVYQFPSPDAPLRSIIATDSMPGSMTIGKYWVCVYLIRFLAIVLLALFCSEVSLLVKKQIPAVLITALWSILPTVVWYLGVEQLMLYGFLAFFHAAPLLQNSGGLLVLSTKVAGIFLVIVLGEERWKKSIL